MNDPRHRRPALVPDRVSALLGGNGELCDTRHKLRRDRIPIVGGIDQLGHLLGDSDSKLSGDSADIAQPFRIDQAEGDKILQTYGGSARAFGHRVTSPELSLVRYQIEHRFSVMKTLRQLGMKSAQPLDQLLRRLCRSDPIILARDELYERTHIWHLDAAERVIKQWIEVELERSRSRRRL